MSTPHWALSSHSPPLTVEIPGPVGNIKLLVSLSGLLPPPLGALAGSWPWLLLVYLCEEILAGTGPMSPLEPGGAPLEPRGQDFPFHLPEDDSYKILICMQNSLQSRAGWRGRVDTGNNDARFYQYSPDRTPSWPFLCNRIHLCLQTKALSSSMGQGRWSDAETGKKCLRGPLPCGRGTLTSSRAPTRVFLPQGPQAVLLSHSPGHNTWERVSVFLKVLVSVVCFYKGADPL